MMNYSMLEEARELAAWSKESEALSIYQALESIEDLRSKQGKRYELALLLTCVLLAKMAGETTLQAICEWIRSRSRWLQDVLPTTRATFPCAASYSTFYVESTVRRRNQVLMDRLKRMRAAKREAAEQEHVVVDGLPFE